MKHLAHFILVLGIIIGCLCSCNRENVIVRHNFSSSVYPNLVGSYIAPDSLYLQFFPEYADFHYVLHKNIFFLCWSGSEIKSSCKKTAKQYKQLSERYGDTDYNGPLLHPDINVALSETIVNMQITALTYFNARHPLGSSLNDIAFCSYSSYSSLIDNDYVYNEEGEYYGDALYSEQMVNELIQTELSLLELYRIQDEFYSANIAFLESPEQARQKICVEVFFENNTVARDTIEVDFVN